MSERVGRSDRELRGIDRERILNELLYLPIINIYQPLFTLL